MKRLRQSVLRTEKKTEVVEKKQQLTPDEIDSWLAQTKVDNFWKNWRLHPEDSWRREKFRDFNGLVRELIILCHYDDAQEISEELEPYGPFLSKQ